MAIFTWDRLTHSAAAAATDAPAPYDYQPIIDQVLDQLRDGSTGDAAERILRGIPEPALMIAKTDLATRGSDLPAEVTPEVTRILNQNHDARAGIRQGLAVDRKWNEGSAAAAYQIVGHRDPKWDDAALAAIRPHIGGRTATAFMNSASQAGCDDPLFVYCRMREIYTGESREGVAAWDAAADVLMASGYPAHLRAGAIANSTHLHGLLVGWEIDDAEKAKMEKWLQPALDLLPEAAKEPGVSTTALYDLAYTLRNDFQNLAGQPTDVFETIDAPLAAAMPKSALRHVLKAIACIDSAMAARGGGFANTVTQQGAQLMASRLKIARAELLQADTFDPHDYRVAVNMMAVVLGEASGRMEMEHWFAKAIEANPDTIEPYVSKMNFLEPKWFGSAAEMIAFGHECAATQNYAPGIPDLKYLAYSALSHYQLGRWTPTENREYFRNNAAAWADIKPDIDQILLRYPNNNNYRSLLARYAVWCGQYDEANKLFAMLGDNVDVTPFGSPAELQKLRAEAANHGVPQPSGSSAGKIDGQP
jgi:hypothetical protein